MRPWCLQIRHEKAIKVAVSPQTKPSQMPVTPQKRLSAKAKATGKTKFWSTEISSVRPKRLIP